LTLKEGTKPIYLKHRQGSFAIEEVVTACICKLEAEGTIERADVTEWGTPIVPSCQKGKKMRICADYKSTINRHLEEDRYPISHIDTILAKLNSGRYFCKLDISQAYLHMPVDDEMAKLQTITTHLRNFRIWRLFFGIRNAPSI